MARIYLLVNVLPGKDMPVRDTLRGIKGVMSADVVTGPYDIVAVVEAGDTEEIFDKVIKKIRRIKGITRTETFVALG
jgi:DNA-binding Lrp family transcriptional regulator